jgi:disulfide bond formation protein DsbB
VNVGTSTINTATTVFALGGIAAVALTVVTVAATLTRRRFPFAATVADHIATSGVAAAALIAAGMTAGSLFLSEAIGWEPCELCWYQRVAAYPIVVVAGVAAVRPAAGGLLAARVLAAVGFVVAAYHVWLQRWAPAGFGTCPAHNPCTLIYIDRFGFTTPTIAGAGFAAITALLWAVARKARTPAP